MIALLDATYRVASDRKRNRDFANEPRSVFAFKSFTANLSTCFGKKLLTNLGFNHQSLHTLIS
jgi:hypothetical protein